MILSLAVFVLVFAPVSFWLVGKTYLPSWLQPASYSAILAVLLYMGIVTAAVYFEAKVESDLQAFDIAHPSTDRTIEQQAERNRLGRKVGHDTGRTFAPITGLIGAVIYFFVVWTAISALSRVFPSRERSSKTI